MVPIPAITGILEAALYVDDVPRSVRFYEHTLGLSIVDTDERLTAMGVGGKQILLLCKREASARLPETAHDASGQQHVAFSVATADLDAWKARLIDLGIAIERDRRWDRGGRSLYFRDPDGHILELASPGVWSSVY